MGFTLIPHVVCLPSAAMTKSPIWIPIVAAATASLWAENPEAVSESTRCSVQAVVAEEHSKLPSDALLEAVALDLMLKKHGHDMTELEQSLIAATIIRLEHQEKASVGTKCSDLGVSVVALDEATRRLIQPQIEGGLRVTEVRPGGVLSFWGVGAHDLIVASNGKPLHNAQALLDTLNTSIEENKILLLDVITQGNRRTINLMPIRNRAKLKEGAPRFWQLQGC